MRFLVLAATLRSLSQQHYCFRGGVHHVPTMSAANAWSPSSSVPRRRALAASSSSSSAAAAAAGPPVTWCPERRVYVGGVVPALSADEVESLLRESEDGSLSVFGYGSLCWRPGEGTVLSAPGVTTSRRRVVGLRRCWAQRSADHRGTPEFPGLVCTLVTDDEYEAILREEGCDHEQNDVATTTTSTTTTTTTTTEGVSYAVPSHLVNDCLAELDFREKGGYARDVVDTVSRDDATDPRFSSTRALLYRGTADNPAFSRRALLDEHYAAATISAATGPSGPNDEYLYELDAFLANDDDADAEDGDAVTRRLAELCRGFRRSGTTFFFLSGCGSTDHGRLSSTLPDHLRTGGNVARLTELAVAVRDGIGEPRALYAGGGHCGVTTTDGRLWLWGWNENGQLGRHDDVDDDDNETPVRPLMVEDDEPLLVNEVSLGHAHTLVIERGTGRLYAFGDDARGQVGGGDGDDESGRSSVVVRPVVPDPVKHNVVVHAAAGVFVSAAVTSEGGLVTWGDRSRSSNPKKQTSFSLRWRPDDGARLVKVACGKRHVVALDDRGRVWTVAAARNDRYGVSGRDPTSDDQDDQDLVPRLVEDLPGGVVDVDCGWSHCVARVRESNDDGVTTTSLYGWGRNDHGQLGVDSSSLSSSSKSSSSVVRRPRRLTDDVVVAVSCGAESTVARTASGALVSCGWNEHGNAGTGGFEDARTWTRIDDDDGARLPPGDRVVFAAGGGHLLVMGTRDVGTSKQT